MTRMILCLPNAFYDFYDPFDLSFYISIFRLVQLLLLLPFIHRICHITRFINTIVVVDTDSSSDDHMEPSWGVCRASVIPVVGG